MTPSEIIAYNYILNQGYDSTEVLFNHSKSPDFITTDNKLWEAKRIYNNGSIVFTYNQLYDFPNQEVTIIITHKDSVFLVVPFLNIQHLINKYTSTAYLNNTVFCMLDEKKMLYSKIMAEWNEYRLEHATEIEADCERWLREREQISELARRKPIL